MKQEQFLDFFKPHAKAFWVATLKRLQDDFKIWQSCEDYEGETFEETMDREFWSMGCDYYDYANDLVDDYFYSVVDKNEYDELKETFAEIDSDYIDLRNYVFETFALPKIKDIINGEETK
jgi:hypothetical protein